MNNAIQRRIADLEQYRPELTAEPDLDAFWGETLNAAKDKPLNGTRLLTKTPLDSMEAYKVEYEGFDSTRIHGWFILPKNRPADAKLPCVVLYHGYTGSKGYPEDFAQYAMLGVAAFAVDIRGQGGDTGNLLAQRHGMTRGWLTQNILDKEECYYKAISIDALKALEWAAAQPEVDAGRICASGGSQGGGLALLAAALSEVPSIAVAHIPNMCHMDFGILNSTSSLTEAADFLNRFPEKLDEVLRTLSYFDMMNLAHRIRIPLLVSVGLKDPVTMPETIFAAYNRIESDKRIEIYPFQGHAVSGDQNRKALEFIRSRFNF
ncbi:alpha/beta fold hydrolase [Cohnella ginsengisoli]|uniref:Alpha/beta fold hydrolase n=2 Tax=Cohnella ginsengisoli TaxID=425004 RepID=A0A9X4KCR5_9BACL|nr:acetylxylan esterase [Cohnella ginsengisoli]MDG0789764.1 alpha/beta fold hydrolase [Cohnella ginsengisoli]